MDGYRKKYRYTKTNENKILLLFELSINYLFINLDSINSDIVMDILITLHNSTQTKKDSRTWNDYLSGTIKMIRKDMETEEDTAKFKGMNKKNKKNKKNRNNKKKKKNNQTVRKKI